MTTNGLVIHDLQIRFQFRTLTCDSDWTNIFIMKRKTGVCIYEVQVKENYRQSGHKRVWDMFLSNYWKGLIVMLERAASLLYRLAIERRLLIAAVHINSRKCRFKLFYDM